MKILDRYVLTTFLKNYAIAFGVLVGMYVTLDMVLNFDELFKGNRPVGVSGIENAYRAVLDVVDFYFYQSLLIFVHLAPIIPLVAAAFTLMRMTRFNELVAALAAGISLRRIATPIIITGVVVTGFTYVAQEVLIPAVIPKLLRGHDEVSAESKRAFPVKAVEDGLGNILIAANFVPATLTAPASMIEVDLLLRNSEHQPTGHVIADKAMWDATAHKWHLANGRYSEGLMPEQKRYPDRAVSDLETTLTPDEITLYRSREFVELLSTSRINELLAQPRNYGVADLLRVKHFRVAQYLNNIALLMLAIPCVMSREPRSVKTGGSFLLTLVGGYLGLIFIAQHLAGQAPPDFVFAHLGAIVPHWPVLMAALPLFIFGPMAIYAFDKMKT